MSHKKKTSRNGNQFSFGDWMKKGVKSRSLGFYEFSNRTWKVANPPEEVIPIHLKKIKIITYNVWFSDYQANKRFSSICRIIKEEKADFVCLQEVNEKFMSVVSKNKFIKQNYMVSDNPVSRKTFNRYGVAQLIRKNLFASILSLKKLSVPSTFNRAMVHMDLLVSTEDGNFFKMNIGTIHLESVSSPELRRVQLMKISKHVQKKYENCILVGDFNFDDERNFDSMSTPLENDFLKHKSSGDFNNYIDVWEDLQLPLNEMGKTFDTDTNPMIHTRLGRQKKRNNQRREVARYDRVMLKSPIFVPTEIRMIGTEVLYILEGSRKPNEVEKERSKYPVLPSDHYGLCCTLEMK